MFYPVSMVSSCLDSRETTNLLEQTIEVDMDNITSESVEKDIFTMPVPQSLRKCVV